MPTLSKTKNSFEVQFKDSLVKSDRPPFLFIGSGLSIRYCSIPTWMNLLSGFVEKNRDCFKFEFGYYSSKCSNNPLKIASQLAKEFHEYWWQTEKYSDSRHKHQYISGLDIEIAFKIELSNYVKECVSIRDGLEEEISLMSNAVISGILTTNWDDFTQNIYDDFQVEIGQKEAIFADQRSIGELYKIHGCTSKPETLVVTQRDYDQFINNNHYLNAKLLTVFAEYPIIFMGYSLSDPNIELILKNLISCLDNNLFQVDKLTDRLFFIEWNSQPCEPSLESSTYTLSSTSIPITKIKINDFSSVWGVLAQLPRRLPVRMLRQLQSMVFDFVSTSDPTGKVFVNGMEELDKIEDLEVVVGFGNISKLEDKGIMGLKSKDLMRDILFDDIHESNYLEIVESLLPSVIRKNVYIPFFKYQHEIQNLNNDNSLISYTENNYTLKRSNKITMEDYRIESGRKRIEKLMSSFNSIEELLVQYSHIHALQYIPFFDKAKIDPEQLLPFLQANWEKFGEKEGSYSSHYRKCICLLDYLKYANHL